MCHVLPHSWVTFRWNWYSFCNQDSAFVDLGSGNILHTVHTSCHSTLQHHNSYNRTDNYRQGKAVGSPDDGHKDARNMLRYYWLPINHYLLHLVYFSFTYIRHPVIRTQHLLCLTVLNLLKLNDIYIYICIYMSYRSANLQTLHFKYLFNKYTYWIF